MSSNNSFRLVPLNEVVATRPVFGLMVSPMKSLYRRLRKGAMVKVQVEAVGHARKAPEEIWVIIREAKNGHYRGVVNTRPSRTQYHGLALDAAISFKNEHIIDIVTQK